MSKVYWNFVKSKYDFVKLNNMKWMLDKFEKDLWEARAFKLLKLYQNLGWYNDIDFSVLHYSEDWLKRFRAEIKKKGYAKRLKLSDKKWYAWYLSPEFWNRNKVPLELWESFWISKTQYVTREEV